LFKKIHFFNGFHCGDVHVSREFVRWIVENVPAEEYVYSHIHDSKLISDIDGLKHESILPYPKKSEWRLKDNALYINTWYRTVPSIHDKYDCTLQCLFQMFKESLEWLDIKVPDDILLFVPRIDYYKYELSHVRPIMSKFTRFRKVFISNGMVLSGQSENFDFDPIITRLADKFKNVIFFVSNRNGDIKKENVIYTRSIIKTHLNDLNENAYIARLCPIIVGRGSGAYTFSLNTDNFFNDNKVMVNFGKEHIGAFGLRGQVPVKFVLSEDYDNVEEVVAKEIGLYWGI